MASKEYTYSDVSEHNTKKDLFVVIDDKIYNASSFVDEHPGGEEVLMDVSGQDATEAFEDVGHSDEARQILNGMQVGVLKRQEGDPKPKSSQQQATKPNIQAGSGNSSVAVYAIMMVGIVVALVAYQYMQAN